MLKSRRKFIALSFGMFVIGAFPLLKLWKNNKKEESLFDMEKVLEALYPQGQVPLGTCGRYSWIGDNEK